MQRALLGLLVVVGLSFTVDTPAAEGQARAVALSALGRCLDVAYGNAVNGAAVQLWECNGSPAQQWFLEGNRVRSALGRCLDVTAGNAGNGARVQTYDCNGTPAQSWTFLPNGALRNGLGTCLDVSSANAGNGAAIQGYQCNGTPAQQWSAR
ncbi:MAG: RICIN domain-containing protein [Sandaracinus sp.]